MYVIYLREIIFFYENVNGSGLNRLISLKQALLTLISESPFSAFSLIHLIQGTNVEIWKTRKGYINFDTGKFFWSTEQYILCFFYDYWLRLDHLMSRDYLNHAQWSAYYYVGCHKSSRRSFQNALVTKFSIISLSSPKAQGYDFCLVLQRSPVRSREGRTCKHDFLILFEFIKARLFF